MQYLLTIYVDESAVEAVPPEQGVRITEAYEALTAELKQAGVFLGGEGLQRSSTATTVRVREGEPLLTDGPFAETREQLAGFYLLECADLDEAIGWAAKVPSAASGSVEVRPVITYEDRVARASYVSGEVVVRYKRSADRAARAAVQRETGVGRPRAFAPRTRVLKIRDGQSTAETLRELRARPEVATAAPNPVARVTGFIPADPGRAAVPGGWQQLQWNFLAGTGVNAPDAWQRMIDVGRPGGTGVTVAVLDTGVAYSDRGRCPRSARSTSARTITCRRSPDFRDGDFVRGYDFVDDDRRPNDENGHGTHVAGTIGEGTGDNVGVTGLAYGARIMPVRVLDRVGEGDSVAISAGIRWAAAHGADVINLSFEFGTQVTRAEIPDILAALRYARRKGVLVVGASGNEGGRSIAYPARADEVLSVGASTKRNCLAWYSNTGASLDIVAPGGGRDARIPGDANCQPDRGSAGSIYQMTFDGSLSRFGLPGRYTGTSMAAPHVSAAAALVIASGVIGPNPSPEAIEERLKVTARDLGTAGPDFRYGYGLLDAARAVTP